MSKNNKILVLGSSGMLGSMVYKYFKSKGFNIIGTERTDKKVADKKSFDVIEFIYNPNKFLYIKDFDYIINCIGIIKPYCKDDDMDGVLKAIQVNANFPHVLSNFVKDSNAKIIQIATDCVYSGSKGQYVESSFHDALDVYGKTKSLGEGRFDNLLNIRCSIIGPELKNKLSLLEWFLARKEGEEVNGFINHYWNGITTLQFAQLCEKIISQNSFKELRKESYLHHFAPNEMVSKYELLKIFNEVFKSNVVVNKGKAPVSVDRTLKTELTLMKKYFKTQVMAKAIEDLQSFMKCNY